MATIIKGSTKRGQSLINIGSRWEGNSLHQIYDRPSTAKQRAFDECWNKYCKTENSSSFGICSFNTFQFSVSWLGTYEGQNAMFLETANNSYIILLDK